MESNHFENLRSEFDALADDLGACRFNRDLHLMPSPSQATCIAAVALQLAGIHDALIRLEATLRFIGVHLHERL